MKFEDDGIEHNCTPREIRRTATSSTTENMPTSSFSITKATSSRHGINKWQKARLENEKRISNVAPDMQHELESSDIAGSSELRSSDAAPSNSGRMKSVSSAREASHLFSAGAASDSKQCDPSTGPVEIPTASSALLLLDPVQSVFYAGSPDPMQSVLSTALDTVASHSFSALETSGAAQSDPSPGQMELVSSAVALVDPVVLHRLSVPATSSTAQAVPTAFDAESPDSIKSISLAALDTVVSHSFSALVTSAPLQSDSSPAPSDSDRIRSVSSATLDPGASHLLSAGAASYPTQCDPSPGLVEKASSAVVPLNPVQAVSYAVKSHSFLALETSGPAESYPSAGPMEFSSSAVAVPATSSTAQAVSTAFDAGSPDPIESDSSAALDTVASHSFSALARSAPLQSDSSPGSMELVSPAVGLLDPIVTHCFSAPATSDLALTNSPTTDILHFVSYAFSNAVATVSATGAEVENNASQNEFTTINLSDLEILAGTESLLSTSGKLETINLSHLTDIIEAEIVTNSGNPSNPIDTAAQDFNDATTDVAATISNSDDEHALRYEPPLQHIGLMKCKVSAPLKIRVFDKVNSCFICEKLLKVKLTRHLTSVHVDNIEVARILSKSCKKEIEKEMELLRHRGNFFHNERVRKLGNGSLILARRPTDTQEVDVNQYGPCPDCLAYVALSNLWRHCHYHCICSSGNKEKGKRDIVMESQALQDSVGTGACDLLRDTVFRSFRNDEISRAAKRDSLIVDIGNLRIRNVGAEKYASVANRMRNAARLLLKLRELDSKPNGSISDWLNAKSFDRILEAAESLSGQVVDEDTGHAQLEYPSVAKKIGHILVQLAERKRGLAMRSDDEVAEKDAVKFLALHQAEWTEQISAAASRTLNRRKFNKANNLPTTTDIKKLTCYLASETIKLLHKHSEGGNTMQYYRELQKVTLARLLVFNKTRPGAVSQLPLKAYSERPNWKVDGIQDVQESMSTIEQELYSRMDMVEVQGKAFRKIALIIPPDVKPAMDVLANKTTRDQAGIKEMNRYFFACPGTLTNIRGGDALCKIANDAKLEHPDRIRCTKLRKYIATVSQILALNSNEMSWLATHLGHDISVHNSFYKLQESSIELCKVSKLLLAVDRGEVGKWAGKSLEEIEPDGM